MLGLQNYLKNKKRKEAEAIHFQQDRERVWKESFLRIEMPPEYVHYQLDMTKEKTQ